MDALLKAARALLDCAQPIEAGSWRVSTDRIGMLREVVERLEAAYRKSGLWDETPLMQLFEHPEEMKKPIEYHGWSLTNLTDPRLQYSLHIGMLPGRKSVCLYFQRDAVIYTLAYFANEKRARMAMNVLDRLILGGSTARELADEYDAILLGQ